MAYSARKKFKYDGRHYEYMPFKRIAPSRVDTEGKKNLDSEYMRNDQLIKE